ncbi:hypothetical protein [Nocardioides sp. zg-1230]|uniref:hypothetical protein n=1 Tax=Nocardioides sp. zg-1230 TaxID=2736601 RepID=UPI001555B4F0|nr:hypothetical protein [Nocardioides sp. zg-1230]NPC42931.1 hypothetical protein [Nocardioides sp. zg-1230]
MDPTAETTYFDLSDPALRAWAATANAAEIAIVSPGDPSHGHRLIEDALSELRERLSDARGRGASIWFMSDYPLSRFPVLAASSLLADAETVRLRLVSDEFAKACVLPLVEDEATAERVVRFAGGSRALLEEFAAVDSLAGGANEKRRAAAAAEKEVASRAWDQLGPDLLSLMDSWVFESCLEHISPEEVPNEAILASLIGSGLVRMGDRDLLQILPFENRQIWIDSLADAVARCTKAPDSWIRVASELFTLERQLRGAVAVRLEEEFGPTWKTDGLHEFAAGLVELARRDGIASAVEVDRIRSPLDWMQLADLITVAERLCAVAPVLGLRADEWQRVRSEVLHVRHRIAHMRLLRAGDLEAVRRVHRLIELRSRM